MKQSQVAFDDLTGIAVTAAPGLIGALLVGLSAAKGLAFRLRLPLATVHHIEAHLFAAQLNEQPVEFPALGLAISGGHTELYYMQGWGLYKLLASTRDDAAGEAFDKVAKLMGLGYPGGPIIEKLAEKTKEPLSLFPISRMKDKSLDFSFSGLKTAVSLEIKKNPLKDENDRILLAAKFQRSVIAEVLARLKPALDEYHPKSFVLGGGVACNLALRESIRQVCSSYGTVLRVPPLKYCADNAAMIAGLGAYQLSQGKHALLSATAVASPSGPSPFLLQ